MPPPGQEETAGLQQSSSPQNPNPDEFLWSSSKAWLSQNQEGAARDEEKAEEKSDKKAEEKSDEKEEKPDEKAQEKSDEKAAEAKEGGSHDKAQEATEENQDDENHHGAWLWSPEEQQQADWSDQWRAHDGWSHWSSWSWSAS